MPIEQTIDANDAHALIARTHAGNLNKIRVIAHNNNENNEENRESESEEMASSDSG